MICKDWSNLAGRNYVVLNMTENVDCVSAARRAGGSGAESSRVFNSKGSLFLPLFRFDFKGWFAVCALLFFKELLSPCVCLGFSFPHTSGEGRQELAGGCELGGGVDWLLVRVVWLGHFV